MKKKLFIIFLLSTTVVEAQSPGGGVTDIDGNSYSTVWLGGIEWMAENLRVKTYNDGSPIPTPPGSTYNWGWNYDGLQSAYDNDPANESIYGLLYNHYVVQANAFSVPKGLCPTGWHVPTLAEIGILQSFVGTANGGGDLKSTGTIESGNGLWAAPNLGATNSTNFNAHPSGLRSYGQGNSYFIEKGEKAVFWAQDITQVNCANGGGSSLHDCAGWWSLVYQGAYFQSSQTAVCSGLAIRCVNNTNTVELIKLNDSSIKERKLLKIVDVLGRETEYKPNVVQIYIYNDGTTERLMNTVD